jgi:hypothetical protein
VLFNEPKLLKLVQPCPARPGAYFRFSALQRAEIAEIEARRLIEALRQNGFSALQRAEIAEM